MHKIAFLLVPIVRTRCFGNVLKWSFLTDMVLERMFEKSMFNSCVESEAEFLNPKNVKFNNGKSLYVQLFYSMLSSFYFLPFSLQSHALVLLFFMITLMEYPFLDPKLIDFQL